MNTYTLSCSLRCSVALAYVCCRIHVPNVCGCVCMCAYVCICVGVVICVANSCTSDSFPLSSHFLSSSPMIPHFISPFYFRLLVYVFVSCQWQQPKCAAFKMLSRAHERGPSARRWCFHCERTHHRLDEHIGTRSAIVLQTQVVAQETSWSASKWIF